MSLLRGQRSLSVVFAAVVLALFVPSAFAADNEPLPIKVVIVTMFEVGETTGDAPGELQLWVERLNLNTVLPLPLGERDLYLSNDGVMATMLGAGTSNAAASAMALGLDERFDLSRAYWLVAGVAGGDPDDISLGSAAWAKHVVDGDLMYEYDGREIPDDWPYGIVPLGGKRPAESPSDLDRNRRLNYTMAFRLNEGLVDWAYALTRDVDLGDGPGTAAYRALFDGYPRAQRAPFVTIGDNLSASTYWHGHMLNRWANDWVRVYTDGDANFVTSDMEDSGFLTALERVSRSGRVDADRVLVLRTVSNYTTPPPGKTPQWSRAQPYPDGGKPAIESAFRVGNVVVQALLDSWERYAEELPSAPDIRSE